MSAVERSYHFADDKPASLQLAPKRPPTPLFGSKRVVGAGLFMIGTIVLARGLIAHGKIEAERLVIASRGNARGEYGKKP